MADITTADPAAAYLAEAERLHHPTFRAPLYCVECARPWPCQPSRLIAAVRGGMDLHRPHGIYDECGHAHADGEPGPGDLIRVDEVGLVCADGFQYRICQGCCTSGAPNWHQTEECVSSHDHGRGKPWCRTHEAMSSALLGEVPEDASL